ncbi:hypothetical protein ASF27_04425 [Methylobacterium sp. Leaf102]|uniref:hypothetical protein n=1 Tax=Methylobacterium sp. Leaf102 TaxID=1736253 RepID=UPI0006F416EF|nr:hypothetical protein [Methylobacterium sp. Leaf102]KQP30196.1 hypothetical protein ASF27_04425 [Methylobacterium sp. Leaf102]
MLVDLFHYLTTPAPWSHRRRGYLRESVLLLSRSRRCRTAWEPHLTRARAVIMRACEGLPRYRTVVVLGSGLLDDVPLDHLARRFTHIRLVDAVHPWPTRWTVRHRPDVTLVTADLTRPGAVPDHGGGPEIDLVISANLLSQLPILPVNGSGGADPQLGGRIVRAHLDGLSRLAARVCLVTDVLQTEEDRDGRVTDRLDLLHGVPVPTPDAVWTWDLAPFGEAARHRRLVHRVHGYADWHAALGGPDRP